MANPFGFKEIAAKIEQVKNDVPQLIAAKTMSYFLRSWKQQGYDGNKWPEVKRRMMGTKNYKYAKPAARTRQILVGSGRAALKAEVNNSIERCDWGAIVFRVKLPYAKVHNEGLRAGRGAGFQMKQRQFMPIEGKGQPQELTDIQQEIITRAVDKAFKI